MSLKKNHITRSPKQIGDFGEGLVNYLLIRKGHEVSMVDHVGADLISAFSGKRYAISVKTRLIKEGSKESKMYNIKKKDIEKLEYYAKMFDLIPLFSLVVSLSELKKIYVFIFPTAKIGEILDEVQHGYSLRYGAENVDKIKKHEFVDFSCWENELIGDKKIF